MYIALYNHLHPDPFHPPPIPPHLAPPRQSPHRGPTPPPPPQHGTTPPMPHPPTIPHEIEKSRKDVLDLTLRNPLLNFRPTKRRGVQVTDELSHQLFRLLVRNERVMYFLPAQESQTPPANLEEAHDPSDPHPDPTLPPDPHHHIPRELLALLSEPPTPPDEPLAHQTDNKLQTALTLPQLNLRLRETFRQARLSIEEQGVNILYLALGILKWYESDTSTTERRAPLILIPVQLRFDGIVRNVK